MGDLRNKVAKIERAKADKAAMEAYLRVRGWRPSPPSPLPSLRYPRCACGLTVYEATVYQCGGDGYFCLVCMPLNWKRELLGHMINCGLPFEATDHGEASCT